MFRGCGWRDDGEGARGRRDAGRDEARTGRRDQRDGGACENGAVHGCAVMTSLFSSMPLSPWILAPRVNCQRPAMPKVAWNR